jgi:hypothetical protein
MTNGVVAPSLFFLPVATGQAAFNWGGAGEVEMVDFGGR